MTGPPTPQYVAKFGAELLVTPVNPLHPRTVITLAYGWFDPDVDEPPRGRWDRPS